jgi:hypothetical protein
MKSFLKNINRDDIYYLTAKSNEAERQFGWDCDDGLYGITWKYIYFLYYMNISYYDWYVFIDDDTFVFNNRLENLLDKYDSNELYYIGKELSHVKSKYGVYMSGGAGYVFSKTLYELVSNFIKQNNIYKLFNHWCDDLCIGLWVQKVTENKKLIQINNNDFNLSIHSNTKQLYNAITFHKVISEELYNFYTSILENEIKNQNKKNDTVVVLITDKNYFNKARRTIMDIRSKGKWYDNIVLITIDFDLNKDFKDYYNVVEMKFGIIDKTILISKIDKNGFSNSDKRELNKLNQWEKFHVFDDYFKKWSRVIYFDAGLRVLDDIKFLIDLDYKNKIIAPQDGKLFSKQEFRSQICFDKPELVNNLTNEFGDFILNSSYLLNCMWIYDTNILNICNKNELIDIMNKHPICRTNEMTVMNLLFNFKYKLWYRLPIYAPNGKYLFEWSEKNQDYPTDWRNYCFIKYPFTIPFDNF